MKLTDLKLNPDNPRFIRDERFAKLVKSISEFPKMMELRPIIIDSDNMILAGNMRYRALLELKFKDISDKWVKKASELTEDEKRRFIIADNIGFGENDWDILANSWNEDELKDWGLDLPVDWDVSDKNDNEYTKKIEAPTYEVKNEKPKVSEVYNIEKTNKLIEEIQSSSIDKKDKDFLIIAAQRHIVFNYELIADFYAHSNKETQELMEKSALIIIDFNKAIENGYVQLSEEIAKQYSEEYPNEE